MAITPNTTFVSGAILTAQQQNNFPRGVMQIGTATANTAGFTAETLTLTAITFTAVANRYYRITYFEPEIYQNGGGTLTQRIRLTNVTGTVLNSSANTKLTNDNTSVTTVAVETFSAGSITVCGTMQISANTMIAQRAAGKYAFLLVEDIGTA
jgi:hypothetical protein